MFLLIFLAALLIATLVAYVAGQRRVLAAVRGHSTGRSLRTNSFGLAALPGFYGQRLAYLVFIPPFGLLLLWWLVEPRLADLLISWNLPAAAAEASRGELVGIVASIREAALGRSAVPGPDYQAAVSVLQTLNWISSTGIYLALATVLLVLLALGLSSSKPEFRARKAVESWNRWVMFTAASVAILITVGIVLSLLFQAISFFQAYNWLDFLTGTRWSPGGAFQRGYGEEATGGVFGVVPLLTGTLLIVVIAMAVAVPVGLMSAIYLGEYASKRVRSFAKPLLEILAGIPTVVYGLFAALTFTPWLSAGVEALNGVLNLPVLKPISLFVANLFVGLGNLVVWLSATLSGQAPQLYGYVSDVTLQTGSDIALAAGVVMGTMIIPFVASLSDDAIRAVPNSLRDGALGLGSTRSEMMLRVILPAALPGIAGGVLLAVSRAIGETMIVVMAAGSFAYLTFNPLGSVSTFTVQINALLTGDLDFGGTKVQAAFAIGIFLFFITLALNTLALAIVRRFREEYD